MVFIKFLLITFVVLFLLGRIGRYLLGMLGRTASSRMQEEFQKRAQHSGQGPRKHHRPEGEIKIDHIPKEGGKRNSNDFEGGEYIDYEEVK